ncbi:CoA binding domain protein [delta proteobacterium NaphS2]|nr:CoA binding domain protein [delta proteobacterium NaphS2]
MDYKRLLEPQSMAVIGVSLHNNRHPANIIYRKNRLRYPLKVFAVNPKGGQIQGERLYERPEDIPEKVDLAIIAVRADLVPDTMARCISAGMGGAVIISGGFAEVGEMELQDRLLKMALEADFPFVGPNCLGIFSPARMDTFFLPPERTVRPAPGNVALVSQSGGVLVDQIVNFSGEGIGLSLGVSIGNKALVDEVTLLEYLSEDPKTDAIAFYLEGFSKNGGRKFVEAACQCEKPIVVLKSGRSPEGRHAVSSHTASLAGDYEVFSQVMAQFGVIEARTQFELVSFCESLSCYQDIIDGNIGIVTGSGGHGALTVDFCASHGLRVPTLSKELQSALKARLSKSIQSIASAGNPVDLTGSAVDDDFVAAVDCLSQSPEVDCLVLLVLPYSPGTTSDLGARLSEIYQREGKPMVAYVPNLQRYRMLIEGFELNHIPVSPAIEGAVLMARAMRRELC